MKNRIVLVNGFSKTYCMTGWRLGWLVMPAKLAAKVELLMVHSVGCTAAFTQEAGLAALNGSQADVETMRQAYRQRRDFIVDALNNISGIKRPVPECAFYVFPDISSFGVSSKAFVDMLLNDAGVAVLPGTDFGAHGEGKIRLTYVGEMMILQEGVRRIARALEGLSK